jgi:AhpD family alkylhydroperoxidase
MERRLNYSKVLPEGMKTINAMDDYRSNSGLESSLLDLIKLRASQINGCGYCIDMHAKDARTGGETEQQLYNLSIWRETPYYTERECAALAMIGIVIINTWNRFAVTFGDKPGSYQPHHFIIEPRHNVAAKVSE